MAKKIKDPNSLLTVPGVGKSIAEDLHILGIHHVKDLIGQDPETLYNDLCSEYKTRIVSYPSPKDVFYNGNLAYPTPLAQGYLLDNRGIGKNIAFLNMTYEEYSNLSEVPSLQNMYNMIIDKDPLVQMCNCGNRLKYANVVSDMNRLINDNKLSKCQKIK